MNKKGFTLVEVVSVVALLAILMILVSTNGFGAFDNTKKKIFEETMTTIKEAANILMVDVEYCNDKIDNELLSNGDGSLGKINNLEGTITCKKLKEKSNGNIDDAKTGEDICLSIPLSYLIDKKYITGSNVETIYKTNPDMILKGCLQFSIPDDLNSKVTDSRIECVNDCDYNKKAEVTSSTTTKTTTTTTTTQIISSVCDGISYSPNTLSYNIICNAKKASENKSTNKTKYLDEAIFDGGIGGSIDIYHALHPTEDNYGVSYYFRGSIIDNYINFANKCWRIVRIEGDGSVKLILEDKDVTCNDSHFTGNWSLGRANYGYYIIDGEYLPDYENIRGLNVVNSQKQVMETFLNNLDKKNQDMLKDDKICIGDTIKYNLDGSVASDSATEWYYDSYLTLKNDYNEDNYPSLKCNSLSQNKHKISPLTIYELVYSGLPPSNNIVNSWYIANNYLVNKSFYTLSLGFSDNVANYMYEGIKSYAIRGYKSNISDEKKNKDGSVIFRNIAYEWEVRPSVSLLSNVIFVSGDGTQENPYIIEE